MNLPSCIQCYSGSHQISKSCLHNRGVPSGLAPCDVGKSAAIFIIQQVAAAISFGLYAEITVSRIQTDAIGAFGSRRVEKSECSRCTRLVSIWNVVDNMSFMPEPDSSTGASRLRQLQSRTGFAGPTHQPCAFHMALPKEHGCQTWRKS